MISDPAAARVEEDLKEGNCVSGLQAGRWRIIAFTFPRLDFAVTATEPDGTVREYGFKADLTNFPATAPRVQIWNHATDTAVAQDQRPKGNPQVEKAFQWWQEDTVYRSWDRMTGPHNNNAANQPHLAWHPNRRLSFIFRDIHGILNLNARARRVRSAA
jgi:hypothetical protein